MTEVFQNVNNFFVEERIKEMSTFPEWKSEGIETSRRELEELLEKRMTAMEEELAELENQYYWVSYVLRGLGYCATAAEPPPGGLDTDDPRPDFTLFFSANDFRRAVPLRGHREFYANALGVMRVLGWDDSMDEIESEDGPYSPAYDVDRFLRDTDTNWGILTNGRVWRLFHRDSSGLMNTFFEIDLVEALESNDLNSFRIFWMVFSPEALGGSELGGAIAQRLLN